MRAKRFRNDDAPVPVEGENLDIAVERDRELIALIRIVRQAREKPVDLARKPFAAAIECRSVERGVAVDAGASSSAIAGPFPCSRETRSSLELTPADPMKLTPVAVATKLPSRCVCPATGQPI
jgi:hypothetical protein